MGRYAMIDDASSIVINVIEWSGNAEDWNPPDGVTMIEDDPPTAGAGFTWDGVKFMPPPSGEPGNAAKRQIAEAEAQAAALEKAKTEVSNG